MTRPDLVVGPEHPDVIVILTDEERAIPSYESDDVRAWRQATLTGRRWFDEHGVRFDRHYTGSLACVPSRPTIFTGQYPDVHGVTQTDGLGKLANDTRMRWLAAGEVPTLGHWFRAGGYDTHYDGKWHITHADLVDPSTGERLNTNDDAGLVDHAGVARYLQEDPLDAFGFSGWVGPEPHGGAMSDSGLVRDPLIADRVVAWLEDRYARRRSGEADARRPFLLVASFVNPHDIVLFPVWARRNPLNESPLDPPHVPKSPTDDEDLGSKPAAQVAYRAAYPSGYGPSKLINRSYEQFEQRYRDTYYRLHAEVDGPLDRVRKAVTDGGSSEAVLVRTSDHGDLLGSHGGLHQKWFTLYDEAVRVPFVVARIGSRQTEPRAIADMPTSHVDIVPSLLDVAGIDRAAVETQLRSSFTEVHPLPGRSLIPIVDGHAPPDTSRSVYLMTRDNMLEGDTGASGVARRFGRTANPPAPLRIQVPAHVASNFEAIVVRVAEGTASGGSDHLWKLVRTFDDPSTWSEPGVRHLAANGPGGDVYRTVALDDQWELYDLTADPIEAANRWTDGRAAEVRAHLVEVLRDQRATLVPARNAAIGMPARSAPPRYKRVAPPAAGIRKLIHSLGMHPDDSENPASVAGQGVRALIVCTNHSVLDIGKPTGLFASEMTAPYYVFLDAGVQVDLASPLGGVIPVDPQSLRPPVRCSFDDRFLADDVLREKVASSLSIGALAMSTYDIVFLAGGWGAAFDFGFSEVLGTKITEANAAGCILGGVCHGPLGLRNAKATNGAPLVKGRHITSVTDKQVRELGITSTPHHPETELRSLGAVFESAAKFRDIFANHWVVDGNLVTGQNQNAGPMVAREMLKLLPTSHATGDVR